MKKVDRFIKKKPESTRAKVARHKKDLGYKSLKIVCWQVPVELGQGQEEL